MTTCEIARATHTIGARGQHDNLREQRARQRARHGGKALELVDVCIGVDEGSRRKTVSPSRQTTTTWRQHNSQPDGEGTGELWECDATTANAAQRYDATTRVVQMVAHLSFGAREQVLDGVRGRLLHMYAARLRAGSRETTRWASACAQRGGEHAHAHIELGRGRGDHREGSTLGRRRRTMGRASSAAGARGWDAGTWGSGGDVRARGARWARSVVTVSVFSAGTSTGRKGPAGGGFWRGR